MRESLVDTARVITVNLTARTLFDRREIPQRLPCALACVCARLCEVIVFVWRVKGAARCCFVAGKGAGKDASRRMAAHVSLSRREDALRFSSPSSSNADRGCAAGSPGRESKCAARCPRGDAVVRPSLITRGSAFGGVSPQIRTDGKGRSGLHLCHGCDAPP